MSSANTTAAIQAKLDAWRAGGFDRLDPIRFHVIDAMVRRAAGHDGDARRLLDDRLSELLDVLGAKVASAESDMNDTDRAGRSAEPDEHRLETSDERIDGAAGPGGKPVGGPLAELIAGLATQTAYPELPVIDYFRETWSKVSTTRQLKQSRQDVPENAGPLNSSHLVHRSLSLMRELSPGYLQQFLSYVDALSWLDQINAANGANASSAATGKDAPRSGGTKKSRGKPR